MTEVAALKYASALGTPIIALIVGLFGGMIAYRQWRTAQDRLKLDLFDRRLVIYQQTRDFLARRMALGQLKGREITEFAVNTRVSRWLFSAAIADYLEGEIAKKAMDLADLNSELEALTDEAGRKQNVSRQRELKDWLEKQLYEVIDAKFGEFLQIRH
ncbi:MAG: hypothetical protein WBD78_10175 [Methylocella sp.]